MPEPTPVYDSAHRGLRFVEEARELWAYRHFVVELTSRDIKVRYKRSALGVAWTMLSPLMTMVVFTLVFSTFQRMPIVGFPVYYLSASMFWLFFAQVTSHVGSLTTDALEITKRIYIPRSVYVASAVGVGLTNTLLSLAPFVLIVVVTGRRVFWTWLFLPVSLLIGTLFAAGVGLVVFTLALRFVDVRDMYQAILMPWFFVTPIIYEPSFVPERWRWIIRYNPMTYLVEIFRAPLYNGWLPGPKTLAFAVLAAISSLVVGWFFYSAKVEEYGLRG
ncbi:MAG TPA: ABC transporter permease [Thermoanaerobaculia bacterium]|nr:ABC transporter permease [Thermoanaerobaculia bacterium]